MRYFATSPAVYSQTRSGLDAHWGHPKVAKHVRTSTDVVTTSCLPEGPNALHDPQGRVLVALPTEWADWMAVKGQLDGLIQGGFVAEMTKEEFVALLPKGELK
jgi:uncharacterized protein (DUF3820 family)